MSTRDREPTVIVVGGEFGRLYAARHAVLIASTTTCFSRCCTRSRPRNCHPASLPNPLRAIPRRYRNVEVVLAEVTQIDVGARRVGLDARRARRLITGPWHADGLESGARLGH
jgi:NADH dehydrogenase FAD-containing subunit